MVSVDLLAPLAYVVVLVTALGIFSSVYRRRKAAEAVAVPWFPSHPARDAYITLLQTTPSPPESLLKSALLLRAMADVRRILKLREDKTALTNLIQKGSVGDDLLVKFQKAEKELEAEVLDVVNEANSFANAWGPGIFQTAQEMVQQQGDAKHRDQIYHVGAKEAARLEQLRSTTNKQLLPPPNPASVPASLSAPSTPAKGSPVTPSVAVPPTTPGGASPASSTASPAGSAKGGSKKKSKK